MKKSLYIAIKLKDMRELKTNEIYGIKDLTQNQRDCIADATDNSELIIAHFANSIEFIDNEWQISTKDYTVNALHLFIPDYSKYTFITIDEGKDFERIKIKEEIKKLKKRLKQLA